MLLWLPPLVISYQQLHHHKHLGWPSEWHTQPAAPCAHGICIPRRLSFLAKGLTSDWQCAASMCADFRRKYSGFYP